MCCGCTLPIYEEPRIHGLMAYHLKCLFAARQMSIMAGLRIIIESRA
jgi:hypothetical protein